MRYNRFAGRTSFLEQLDLKVMSGFIVIAIVSFLILDINGDLEWGF